MFPTYPAVLRAGQLEWEAGGPPDDPVHIHVTVLAPLAPFPDSGPSMASALAALAAAGGPSGFDDPADAPVPEDIPPVESWVDRLVFDSAVEPIERIVKGTRLTAEALVAEIDQGRSDEQMLHVHSELSKEDLQALRQYARWPVGLRRSCGAWEEDAEELDKYLEWTRQQRKTGRREIED